MRFDLANHSRRMTMGVLAAAALAALFAAPAARAEIAGQLQCNIAGGEGALITSTRAVSCVFRSAGGPDQLYNGTLGRLGLDLGPLTSGTLTYQVLELGTAGPGDLQGSYIGAGAGVTLGQGVGIDTLVGGNANSVTLQPIAITTGMGTNINAGLGALQLRYAGLAVPERVRHRRRRIVARY